MASKYDKRKLQDLIRASNGQMDQALGVVVEEMRNEIVESFGTSPAGRGGARPTPLRKLAFPPTWTQGS